LKDQHQASLMTARQESAKATEEHLATKASLEEAKAQLEAQKAEIQTKLKVSEDDYRSMHSSLTELAEEAHSKITDLEARLKETEAQLKVKAAELAEAKVYSPLCKSRSHC
jgi:predicted nuclease with TOPRIM domain